MQQHLKQYLAPVWTHLAEVLVERGKGIYLFGSDGRLFGSAVKRLD